MHMYTDRVYIRINLMHIADIRVALIFMCVGKKSVQDRSCVARVLECMAVVIRGERYQWMSSLLSSPTAVPVALLLINSCLCVYENRSCWYTSVTSVLLF